MPMSTYAPTATPRPRPVADTRRDGEAFETVTGAEASDMPHPDALTVPQVAEELATIEVRSVAMLRRGEPRGIELGERGQWRVAR